MARARIKWDHRSKEFYLLNLISYVNAYYRVNDKLRNLAVSLGFNTNQSYRDQLAQIFVNTCECCYGFPYTQVSHHILKREEHYIYHYTKGKHGFYSASKAEELETQYYVKKFEKIGIKKLIRKISKIINTEDLRAL